MMENGTSVSGRRRGYTKHSAEDQTLGQIAKEKIVNLNGAKPDQRETVVVESTTSNQVDGYLEENQPAAASVEKKRGKKQKKKKNDKAAKNPDEDDDDNTLSSVVGNSKGEKSMSKLILDRFIGNLPECVNEPAFSDNETDNCDEKYVGLLKPLSLGTKLNDTGNNENGGDECDVNISQVKPDSCSIPIDKSSENVDFWKEIEENELNQSFDDFWVNFEDGLKNEKNEEDRQASVSKKSDDPESEKSDIQLAERSVENRTPEETYNSDEKNFWDSDEEEKKWSERTKLKSTRNRSNNKVKNDIENNNELDNFRDSGDNDDDDDDDKEKEDQQFNERKKSDNKRVIADDPLVENLNAEEETHKSRLSSQSKSIEETEGTAADLDDFWNAEDEDKRWEKRAKSKSKSKSSTEENVNYDIDGDRSNEYHENHRHSHSNSQSVDSVENDSINNVWNNDDEEARWEKRVKSKSLTKESSINGDNDNQDTTIDTANEESLENSDKSDLTGDDKNGIDCSSNLDGEEKSDLTGDDKNSIDCSSNFDGEEKNSSRFTDDGEKNCATTAENSSSSDTPEKRVPTPPPLPSPPPLESQEVHRKAFSAVMNGVNQAPKRKSVIQTDERERRPQSMNMSECESEPRNRTFSMSSYSEDEMGHDSCIMDYLGKENDKAEARLAARRLARVEAREIRLKEIERQQREQEENPEKFPDLQGSVINRSSNMSPRERTSLNSYHSSRRSSEDSMDDSFSLRDLRHELKEVEEKFRKAMIANAQLDNEKTSLSYQVELLKDKFEELENFHIQLTREHKEKCREFEAYKRATIKLKEDLSVCKMCLEERDRLIADYGLVIVGGEIGENGEITPRALITQESAHILENLGEGSLDVRLKRFSEEKEELSDEIRHLKLELEEERCRRRNDKLTNGSIDEELSQTLSDYKFRLQKAEQDVSTLQATVARLESQVIRYKTAAETYEKSEEELKQEKRKLQREQRESMTRIEELETANSHLQRRMDKLKNAKSTLLKEL